MDQTENQLECWKEENIKNIYYNIKDGLFDVNSSRNNPVWDGGIDKYGITRKSSWKKIADFLKKNQIYDVYGFIYANLVNRSYKYVFPNTLYSNRALSVYSKMEVQVKKEFYSDLCNYVEILKRKAAPLLIIGYSPEAAIEKILLDPECPIPPLFRSLLALKYNLLGRIPERVLKRAAIAYPVYRELCDKHDYRLGEYFRKVFPELNL